MLEESRGIIQNNKPNMKELLRVTQKIPSAEFCIFLGSLRICNFCQAIAKEIIMK